MSISLWRSQGENGVTATGARNGQSMGRKDQAQEFVRRHQIECSKVLTGTVQQRIDFAANLSHVITDTRNLKRAVDVVAAKGAVVTSDDPDVWQLDEQERWDLARALQTLLQSGHYRPEKPRQRRISKGGDRGHRTISAYGEIDRIVQRAILQIVQPLIDPTFADCCMGYRPGIGRNQPLAMFVAIMSHGETPFVVAEDLKDAFNHVPRKRLWDILRKLLPDDIVSLIETATNIDDKPKGLPQGGNLGPFLLNAYLNHFLDRRWKHKQSTTPLITVADDLLVACRTKAEAEEVHEELTRLMTNAGMKMKCGKDKAISHVENGETVEWLGYRIQGCESRELRITVSSKGWDQLRRNLEECKLKRTPSQCATDCILGGVSQLGPCLPSETVERLYERIHDCAQQCGFYEIPSLGQVRSEYERAYRRWQEDHDDATTTMTHEYAAGSAERAITKSTDFDGDLQRGAAQQDCAASTPQCFDLFTDGSCLQPGGAGGWAFICRQRGTRDAHEQWKGVSNTTNNQMELLAVIEGLRATPEGAMVRLRSDSRYVLDGIQSYIEFWKANRWRRSGGRLKNRRLWKALDRELSLREVDCRWIRGHSGHLENERCDQLAHDAALGVLGR